MKSYTFFPSHYKKEYPYPSKIISTLEVLNEIVAKINNPFIFNAGTLDNSFLDVFYKDEISVKYAIINILSNSSGKENIWDIAKIACIEDTEWGDMRNKNLTGKYFYKYTLKPDYIKIVLESVQKWILDLDKLLKEMQAEEENERLEKEKRKQKFAIVKVYKKTMPKGGEEGVDGYFDADITDGKETIRFVARNVFDFGYYSYPKRVEGTGNVLSKEGYTELEKEICDWLYEFRPFSTGIRM